MVETAPALIQRLQPYGPELHERIIAAALGCIARWGVSKTTLDDIARAAGCSRATVYRTFPGGKDALLDAVGERELERFFGALAGELALVDDLEDALVLAITEACRAIADHAALQYLFTHEIEVVLPYVSFEGAEPLLAWSGDFAAIHLARFLDQASARALGEWCSRIVVSYGCAIDGAPSTDLSDPDQARGFVRTFILPGLAPEARSTALAAPNPTTTQE